VYIPDRLPKYTLMDGWMDEYYSYHKTDTCYYYLVTLIPYQLKIKLGNTS